MVPDTEGTRHVRHHRLFARDRTPRGILARCKLHYPKSFSMQSIDLVFCSCMTRRFPPLLHWRSVNRSGAPGGPTRWLTTSSADSRRSIRKWRP